MYNIYYSLADSEWQGQERNVVADTVIEAYMEAVRLIREVLSTNGVEFLVVGEMEFVIWAFGKCKGYLAIKEHGPKTSAPDLCGG